MSANKQMKTLSPQQYAFVLWLYKRHPNLARAAEARHESLEGFLDTASNVFNNIVEKAPDLLKTYVTGEQQIQQMKLNLERAKAGQYPLDSTGALYTGGGGRALASSQIPTWVWIAGGGLVAFLLITTLRK